MKIPIATAIDGAEASSKIMIPINGDEVSLYFHIPFCKKKCPYCHFYVLPNRDESKTLFLDALEIEWGLRLKDLFSKKIATIYFGGGTPTLFGATLIGKILSWIKRDCILASSCEITIEANPEEVTLSLMQEFKEADINRVSLGVQSFDDELLLTLGRNHSAQKALKAIHLIKEAGFDNISIDLMYDLPKQSLQSFKRTLEKIADLPITHLSLYNLVFEPQSVFFKKKKELTPLLPTDDASLKMVQSAVALFEDIGLKRYEISAFAKEGFYSKHNTGYWLGRPFLGFGPSAFSYWNKKRFCNRANLKLYANDLSQKIFPIEFEEELAYPNNLKELLAVELRLMQGVNLDLFQTRHGALPNDIFKTIELLQKKRWLEIDGSRIALSKTGVLFYDSVAQEII